MLASCRAWPAGPILASSISALFMRRAWTPAVASRTRCLPMSSRSGYDACTRAPQRGAPWSLPMATARSTAASTSARRSSSGLPRGPPAFTSMCTRFFSTFGSGTRWKKMRWAAPVGIADGAGHVPVALRDAVLGQPRLPRVVAGRWRVELVAEHVGPEVGEAVWIGTVEGDLDRDSHRVLLGGAYFRTRSLRNVLKVDDRQQSGCSATSR